MKREDFHVIANPRGYQVQYKGQNIGGAGISDEAPSPKGMGAWKQAEDNLALGESDVEAILAGKGRPDMLEAISKQESK